MVMIIWVLLIILSAAALGYIVRSFTVSKVFDLNYRSGVLRLAAGIIIALLPTIWWGFGMHGVMYLGEFGVRIVATLLMVCVFSSIVLIPVGLIQVLGTSIEQASATNK